MSKIPISSSLSLKQFIVRQNVLSLYRKILRTIKEVPHAEDREYLKNWVRSEFEVNRNLTDEFAIKSSIVHGENSIKELQKTLHRTK